MSSDERVRGAHDPGEQGGRRRKRKRVRPGIATALATEQGVGPPAKSSEGSGAWEDAASVGDRLGLEDGVRGVLCPICAMDIGRLSLTARERHAERCLRKACGGRGNELTSDDDFEPASTGRAMQGVGDSRVQAPRTEEDEELQLAIAISASEGGAQGGAPPSERRLQEREQRAIRELEALDAKLATLTARRRTVLRSLHKVRVDLCSLRESALRPLLPIEDVPMSAIDAAREVFSQEAPWSQLSAGHSQEWPSRAPIGGTAPLASLGGGVEESPSPLPHLEAALRRATLRQRPLWSLAGQGGQGAPPSAFDNGLIQRSLRAMASPSTKDVRYRPIRKEAPSLEEVPGAQAFRGMPVPLCMPVCFPQWKNNVRFVLEQPRESVSAAKTKLQAAMASLRTDENFDARRREQHLSCMAFFDAFMERAIHHRDAERGHGDGKEPTRAPPETSEGQAEGGQARDARTLAKSASVRDIVGDPVPGSATGGGKVPEAAEWTSWPREKLVRLAACYGLEVDHCGTDAVRGMLADIQGVLSFPLEGS